jgi:hypothetical protein
MSTKANIKIGSNCSIQLDADNPVDLIKAASQFTQLPSKCGHCESLDLSFMHRTAGNSDEYDYLHLKCGDCGAQCDIGQKKVPKGDIFFKHNPQDRSNVKGGFYKYWEQSQSGGNGNDSAPTSVANNPPANSGGHAADDDDIPF